MKKATLYPLLLLAASLFMATSSWAVTNTVTAPISGATTWFGTNTYILDGFIYVLDGGVLTIQPGTVIQALEGERADSSCLIVTRGGKIFANGTRARPIIFTSIQDDVNDPSDMPLYTRGLWGGVVILGRSVLNTASNIDGDGANPKYDVFEALEETVVNGQNVHRYGGNDDNDSSGVMRYVSIRHAGTVFSANRELNGLSLGAVGRGTTLEYIETFCTRDDGFEFFGGTVNTKYLVSAFNDDDAFDADQGFRGKNQFWFSLQEPLAKDNGGEWNGEPNTLVKSNTPLATFQVFNATFIGAGMNSTANRGLLIRDYCAPTLYNSILTDFGGVGVTVETRSVGHLQSGLLDLRDNIWWRFAGNLHGNPEAQVLFTDTSRSNINVDPILGPISRIEDGRLDPRPQAGSPALGRGRPVPAGYTPANYTGAFGSINWATHWTALGELGMITTAGATAPLPGIIIDPDPECSTSNRLTITRTESDVTISWVTENGRTYQIQSKLELSDANWDNEGDPITGDGSVFTQTFSSGAGNMFFRVLCNNP